MAMGLDECRSLSASVGKTTKYLIPERPQNSTSMASSWHHDMVLPKWPRFVWSRRVPEIQVRMKGCALRVGQKRIEHSLTFQIIIGFGRS